MRYVLGFCVVLAVGNPAWTSELSRIAGEPEYQAPSATVTAPVTQATGSPVFPAAAYQNTPAQPTTPTMTSPGSYSAGAQPVATYATPMSNTTYVANPYPTMMGSGMYSMTSPVYSYPTSTGMTTYGGPVQTYTVMPGQTYYEPVQRRFGLFQRRRQQFTPAYNAAPVYGAPMYGSPVYGTVPYGASVYSASGYPTAVYAVPVYTTYSYGTTAYYPTTYAAPATTLPMSSMTPGNVMAPSTTPVYTPTTLNVPSTTPAAGAAPSTGATPAGTAPAEPPFQGNAPASTAPPPPGAVQGTGVTPAGTTPAPPPIPRTNRG